MSGDTEVDAAMAEFWAAMSDDLPWALAEVLEECGGAGDSDAMMAAIMAAIARVAGEYSEAAGVQVDLDIDDGRSLQ